ncbi:SusE domain-containing protein [Pedobacter fastidiosus]|uniref:SusE domain-containing protein n=1 Tax=Pedobacter fastidiosus TaxID=2765361 RepID=A0ABR7KQI7_9SPHI|nr:SusE domain-containing protein [Pedobacter fastidiosus]MBC6109973.1 SusE domain-containing protein [Pedobacter fastidiosus]
MKRLIYFILFFVTAFTACKKDNNIVATIKTNVGAPIITIPVNASAIVITAPDTTKAFKVKWKKADFGVAVVLNYTVQLDAAGKNFASAVNIGNSNADSVSMSLGSLNTTLLNVLNLTANAKSDVEIRVTATLSNNNKITSVPIKISVTTYKELAPDKLFVPGAYQNWAPDVAPFIRFVADSKYEGFVYMSVADQFKFTSAADWNHINYGDGGAGKLTTDGLAGGVTVSAPGYYKLNVDTKNLTYSTALIQSFGIIGSATSGVWDNSTPMTYDKTNGVWKVTANLVAGALKFRANNVWDINFGPADVNAFTGTLIQTNDAITITANGNYTITIDFKQATANKYLYTVVKN